MNPDELVEGEYYWIRDKASGEVEVGRYYFSAYKLQCFDLCGWEGGSEIFNFEILGKIVRDYRKDRETQ